jgi:hypothetical protein
MRGSLVLINGKTVTSEQSPETYGLMVELNYMALRTLEHSPDA